MYRSELLKCEYGRFTISNRRKSGIMNKYYIKSTAIIITIFNFNGSKS